MAILSSEEVKMTSLTEHIIGIIAPNRCISCSNYNNILCDACRSSLLRIAQPFCVRCTKPTSVWQICNSCSSATTLSGVYVGGEYDGLLAELIKQYKFSHVRSAYKPLAAHIMDTLPYLDPSWVVVAVPTVPAHIRERGYDQALLLGREVAKQAGVPYIPALRRVHNKRQIGASRSVRLTQMKGEFEVLKPQLFAGKQVLLVDDVCTTGSTLSAAAQALTHAGAATVWGVVAAWKR